MSRLEISVIFTLAAAGAFVVLSHSSDPLPTEREDVQRDGTSEDVRRPGPGTAEPRRDSDKPLRRGELAGRKGRESKRDSRPRLTQRQDNRRSSGVGSRRARSVDGPIGGRRRTDIATSSGLGRPLPPVDGRARDRLELLKEQGVRSGSVASSSGRGSRADDPGSEDLLPSSLVDALEEEEIILSTRLDGDPGAGDSDQPLAEENVELDDQGEGLNFPEDAVMAFSEAGSIRPDAGTISLEIEPEWNASDPGQNSLFHVRDPEASESQLALYRHGNRLSFVWADAEETGRGIVVDISEWTAGESHGIAASWDQEHVSLYIDGRFVARADRSSEFVIPPDTLLFLGASPHDDVPGAGAMLRNLKVYGRALDRQEITGGSAAKPN